MIRQHQRIALLTILFILAIGFAETALAENHALLIGIGKYRHRTLEGPPFDVAALSRVLSSRYDYPKENIRTLVNEEAAKSRILFEIERLQQRTRPGDRIFIYFSGHGTSRRDEVLALPLPNTTGALVPADFNADPGQPVEKILSQLIIGKRDLRPALDRLDRDRQVLMIFDTCFSGNTVRAAAGRTDANSSRYLPLETRSIFKAEQEIGSFAENLNPPAPYPYQNIFYISAASENEVAKDIRKDNLAAYPTVDGNPHGVLTDALLRVMMEQIPVDSDKDGQWSQIELYDAVKKEVERRFDQSPQALPKPGSDADRLYARTFFVRSADGIAAAPELTANQPSDRPAGRYESGYTSSYALVVGINKYQNWPRLEYAADDAREMAARLEAQGFQVYLLTDEQATLQNILARLETIRRSVDENSRLMFYFAGHGQTEDLPGGRERGYIVPADADAYNWHETMLPMERLNRMISRFSAKHILLAFDSCYSGLGLSRSINNLFDQDSAYIRKMMRSRSIQILTAGSRSEQVLEAGGHGLFTDNLLAALAGAADINSDGYITATEIYATLRPAITQQSYSRQTPQFGYIEGNGDFIFLNSSPEPAKAAIVVETAISGIDVWAGSSEIGHHLSAGRHRLTAMAGHTSLMVKKGGRTLYRNHALLSANRVFPVRIGAAQNFSPRHEAFSTISIADHNVDNYSNSIAYDLDGDGREEMVTASGTRLYAFRFDGTIFWHKKFNFPITLDLIDEWNSQPAIGLSLVEDDYVRLLLLNQHAEPIWQHVRKLRRDYRGLADGGGKVAGLADIDRNGDTEVVAVAEAEYTLKPRGIIVYDSRAREMWRYSMGPAPQNIMIWEKDSGRPDIIIGTYGSGGGNRESHNNTSDMQSYIISVNGFGKTNWLIPVGEYYTGVAVQPGRPKSSSRGFFYAHSYASSLYRKDQGAIYKISRSGQILNRFQSENSILSAATSDSDTSGGEYVYAADSRGNLLQLDNGLNLIRTMRINAATAADQIRLVGVHDYDGDGNKDLLMYSFNRLLHDKNPLAASNPHDHRFLSDLKFQVVSHDFSRVIKSVTIAEEWKNGGGFSVKDLDRPETSQYPFMTLSDKITLFNY